MTSEDIERWSPFKVWLYALFSRNPKSNRAAVELAELSEEDRLLDIGCGPGAALEYAVPTGAEVVGIDPSPSMVARAQRRVPSARVEVGSAEDLPFPEGYFNVVINVLSFHHWADRDAGLREILRVLAPGGHLHLVEGSLKEDRDGHGLNPRDAQLLANRLLELGYVEASTTYIKPGRWRPFVLVSARAPGTG